MKKNILIWGTSFLIEAGLRSVLEDTGRYAVTGYSGSLEDLAENVLTVRPDAMIIDASSPDFEASDADILKSLTTRSVVLLLLDTINRSNFQRYTEAGIENLLLQNALHAEILTAAESAINRRKYYSSEILEMILESIDTKSKANVVTQLTPSEKEIVRLIAGGLTTKEIANRRNISFHTVNTHRKNIFRKLEVSNTSELIMKALKAGWIDNIEYYI